tara:strand:- start:248 stop:484 length:237 start_codon:yes stop_codon:yes gene_type:complete
MSFTFKQFRRWLGAMSASPDTIVLGKVKDWLEAEVEEFDDNTIEKLSPPEEDLHWYIHRGRNEAATGLLEQIRKWEGQ